MRTLVWALLAVAISSSSLALAAGEQRPDGSAACLAVVGFKVSQAEVESSVGVGVGEELATRLAMVPADQLQTLERLQVNEVLARVAHSPMLSLGEEDPASDQACAAELRAAKQQGTLFGADLLLLGSVRAGERTLTAQTRLVSVATGVIEGGVISEVPRSDEGLVRDVQALAGELAVSWCEKLGVTSSSRMREPGQEKAELYLELWQARQELYEGQAEACLRRTEALERSMSDLGYADLLLKTVDEAWEARLAQAGTDQGRVQQAVGEMLSRARGVKDYFKLGHAMACYYLGRSYERAGMLQQAEAEYRECLQQRPSRLLWEFEAEGAIGSPVIVDGVAYAVSGEHHLHAFDAKTGKLLWEFEFGDWMDTPVVVEHVVYAGSDDGHLRAFEASTGKLLWDFEAGGPIETPVAVEGVAYAGSDDGHLRAFDAKTGELLWEFQAGDWISTEVVMDGVVYAWSGFNDSHLRAFAAMTGQLLWKYEVAGDVDTPMGTPVVESGVVYVGGSDEHLRALDAKTGQLLWQFEAEGSICEPVVANDMAYVGSDGGSLWAFGARTGERLWTFTAGDGEDHDWWPHEPELVVVEGSLYVTLWGDSRLRALNALTGEVLWETDPWGQTTPVVIDKTVYTGSKIGRLQAYDAANGRPLWEFQGEETDLELRVVVDGGVYATWRSGGLRVFDAQLPDGTDYAERATSALMRVLREKGRSGEALRMGARLWRENPSRALDTAAGLADAALAEWGGLGAYRTGLRARLAGLPKEEEDALRWIGHVGNAVLSPPVVWSDMVYVVSWCGEHLQAIDVKTGELVWEWKDAEGEFVWETVVADAILYVGSNNGQLRALDATSGELLWGFRTEGRISTPVVASGLAYAASEDQHLRAFDAKTGELLWELEAAGKLYEVASGVVYVGSDEGHLRALDAATGELLWEFEAGARLSTPVVESGVVYAASEEGHLRAFDAITGELLWFEARGGIETPMVVDGVAYVVLWDGTLRASQAKTGHLLWEFEYWDHPPRPAVLAGEVLYAESHGCLLAFGANTGELLWETPGSAPALNSTPVVVSGTIYTSAWDGLQALDAVTGRLLWGFQSGAAYGAPLVVDGVVYAGAKDGHLRAFDARTGELLGDLDGAGLFYTPVVVESGVALCGGPDWSLRAFNLTAMSGAPRPEATWDTDTQFWSGVIWGKGGLAVRKMVDGYALSQILRYDTWASPDELAAEIERLAALGEQPNGLGEWDGPLALSLDPATLCPPELKPLVRADLTELGMPRAAQVYLAIARRNAGTEEQLEYAQEALRLAPGWEEARRLVDELRAPARE